MYGLVGDNLITWSYDDGGDTVGAEVVWFVMSIWMHFGIWLSCYHMKLRNKQKKGIFDFDQPQTWENERRWKKKYLGLYNGLNFQASKLNIACQWAQPPARWSSWSAWTTQQTAGT